MVGNPHRAHIYQFELFELILLLFNSSFSKLFNSSFSSYNFSIRAFRADPLAEIIQAAPCRAIRGNSSVNSNNHITIIILLSLLSLLLLLFVHYYVHYYHCHYHYYYYYYHSPPLSYGANGIEQKQSLDLTR